MKTARKFLLPCLVVAAIVFFSSFKGSTSHFSSSGIDLVYAGDDDTTYKNVTEELEQLEKQLESEMTEEEKAIWTPVVAVVRLSVGAVRVTVAATRAAVALTRAATPQTPRFIEATRYVPTGYLLQTLTALAQNKNFNYQKLMDEYKTYKMSTLG